MPTISSKLRIEEHRNYLTDIIYKMIVKVKRLNNYKSAHKAFKTKKREKQKLCDGHYIQYDDKGKMIGNLI